MTADDTLDRLYREFYRGRGLDMVLQSWSWCTGRNFDLNASRSTHLCRPTDSE